MVNAGANPSFVIEDRAEYLSNFNWIPNWIENYFLIRSQILFRNNFSFINILFPIFKVMEKLNLLEIIINLFFRNILFH